MTHPQEKKNNKRCRKTTHDNHPWLSELPEAAYRPVVPSICVFFALRQTSVASHLMPHQITTRSNTEAGCDKFVFRDDCSGGEVVNVIFIYCPWCQGGLLSGWVVFYRETCGCLRKKGRGDEGV